MGALIPAAGQGLSVYEAPDNPWAEAAASVEGGAYLKFNGNTGEYTFGADDAALEYGSQVVADLFNVGFGWICWKDSEPVEELLVKILDGKPPLEHNLPDHGPYDSEDDGWREATALPMILLTNGDGPDADADAGLKLNFKGSSGSSVRGVRKLSGAFGKLFREHQGEFPVVELSAEQFAAKEKKYGKKYAPIFTIKGWISEDELAGIIGDVSGGDYEPEEPAAAAPVSRRLAAPAAAEEPAEEPEEIAAEEDAAPAPAPRRAAAAEAAPRTRRTAPVQSQEDDLPAPEPRGRSEARRSPAAAAEPAPAEQPTGNRRVRRF
jgi:hypothetical protein